MNFIKKTTELFISSRLTQDTVYALLFKIVGGVLMFLFGVAAARVLGARGSGAFYWALAWFNVVMAVATFGLDNFIVREVAVLASRDQWAILTVTLKNTLALAFGLALFGAVGLWIYGWLGTPLAMASVGANKLLLPLGLALPAVILAMLYGDALRGVGRIQSAILIQSIGLPLIALLSLTWAAHLGGTLGVAWAYSGAGFLLLMAAVVTWRQKIVHVHPAVLSVKHLFRQLRANMPLAWVTMLGRAQSWIDILVLGFYVTASDLGDYNAALRIAALISFMLGAVNVVAAPRFAAAAANSGTGLLRQDYERLRFATMIMSFPVIAICILWPAGVLSLFGPGFDKASEVLRILAFGQFVNALTGPSGTLLIMSRHERFVAYSLIFSVGLTLTLCLLLVPIYGIVGAAVGSTSGLIVLNTGIYIKVRRVTNLAQ